MPSSLDDLARAWRERADKSRALAHNANLTVQELSENDPRFAPSVSRHATLDTAADLWEQAATELEEALKGLKKNPRP